MRALTDVGREALMVLDVAGRQVVAVLAFEFGEQFLRHLAQGVDQDVEAAAMGHADDDFLDALFTGALDGFVERDDETFAAFEREPFLADVAGVQVTLQAFGRGQAVEDVALLFRGEIGRGAHRLEALLHPALLGRIGQVHEFHADVAAVGVAQVVEQVAQGRRLGAEIGVADVEDDVHVGIGETVEARFQFRNRRTFLALQRIEVGPHVADEAVGRDQLGDCDALAAHLHVGGSHDGADRAGLGAFGEGGDDRRVGDIGFRGTVDGRHVLHVVEVRAPVVRHGSRIVEVRLVQFFDVRRVASKQIGVGL
jgi:hypothetical protein